MPTRPPLNSFVSERPPLGSFVKTPPVPVDTVPVAKRPNAGERVAEAYRTAGSEIVSSIRQGVGRLAEPHKGTFLDLLQRTGTVLRTGLRVGGSISRAAFAPILEAPGIKQTTEFAVGKIAQNEKVRSIIQSATDLAIKYPNTAKDLRDVVDIVSLGYAPVAGKAVAKEAGAVVSDVSKLAQRVLTPSEEAVQRNLVTLFQKSIKPTAKKTLAQGQRYGNDIVGALRTIKANADNLNLEDVTGELVQGTPKTIHELSQAVDQTKKLVFDQYDALARQAGQKGAVVSGQKIAEEVSRVAQNTALQITRPELVKYAEDWAKRLSALGDIDAPTAQEVIKNLNVGLKGITTYDTAQKAAIDAGIANNFRKALDEAIEGATGSRYQVLKNQYGALRAIENDVVRASMREARKNIKGLLDYTDIFTGGQMLSGILSLNPAMFTKGAIERGIKEYIKFLGNPNRAVSKMFTVLDTSTIPPFSPESATFQFIKKPKVGLGIEDVSGKVPLLQEARKYKSAEEFVKAKSGLNYDELLNDKIKLRQKIQKLEPQISEVNRLESSGKYLELKKLKTELNFTENAMGKMKETKSQLTDIWNKAHGK